MRVLHLGKYLPPRPGGIERFLGELLPAQRRLGIRPAALVHAEAAAAAGCRRQGGAAAIRVPVAFELAFTPISPSWPARLDRLLHRWRPALLHLHLPNPSAFWALALPSARRVPWLVHWHADVPVDALDARLRLLYRLYRPMETAVLRRAARVIATSAAYAASSPALAAWRDKVAVVPLGLPDAPAAPPDPRLWPSGTGQRLLFVGRFSYYKGIEHLIDALALLPASVGLLLIGAGERQPALEARVRRLGLATRVRFAGALDDAALAGAYAAADLLCLPSIERSEAFGLVLLEAMRARLAALATTVPGSGMADVLADGRAGALVDPGQPGALAAAIAGLLDDPVARAGLAARGRQRFEAQFGIDAVAAALAGHYRAISR